MALYGYEDAAFNIVQDNTITLVSKGEAMAENQSKSLSGI